MFHLITLISHNIYYKFMYYLFFIRHTYIPYIGHIKNAIKYSFHKFILFINFKNKTKTFLYIIYNILFNSSQEYPSKKKENESTDWLLLYSYIIVMCVNIKCNFSIILFNFQFYYMHCIFFSSIHIIKINVFKYFMNCSNYVSSF